MQGKPWPGPIPRRSTEPPNHTPASRPTVVVVGRPPTEDGGEPTLLQLLLSLAANLADAATAPVLVVPSTVASAAKLQQLLTARPAALPRLSSVPFPDVLRAVAPGTSADLDRIPETFAERMMAAKPGTWKTVPTYDIGRYTGTWRSVLQATAVRYAMSRLGADSVLLLRQEAYLWKRTRLSELMQERRSYLARSLPTFAVMYGESRLSLACATSCGRVASTCTTPTTAAARRPTRAVRRWPTPWRATASLAHCTRWWARAAAVPRGRRT